MFPLCLVFDKGIVVHMDSLRLPPIQCAFQEVDQLLPVLPA